ncbi:hypothetical protein I4U23_004554 [Adineta vaga]|nr:hypothetical protein I4U23_004554 [Adineta vaga]
MVRVCQWIYIVFAVLLMIASCQVQATNEFDNKIGLKMKSNDRIRQYLNRRGPPCCECPNRAPCNVKCCTSG